MIKLTPREYQKSILERALSSNTLVVLPTGLGKTLIALLLSIERLKKFPTEKIIFLAPTKPLIEQHFNYYKENLPDLYADLQLFTGSTEAGKRKKIFQTAEIVFSTPQCIANDLENYLYDLSSVSLLIVDEAHRCLKNYDYTKILGHYIKKAANQRILGLTASPGSDLEKVREICRHLNAEEIELRTRESDDVKPYLQELEFTKVEVPFPKEFQEIKVLLKRVYDSKTDELRLKKLLFGPANKITLLKLQNNLGIKAMQKDFSAMYGMSLTAQAIKISHAIELLETQTLAGLNQYLQSLVKQADEKKTRAVQQLVKSQDFQGSVRD